jgi:hypothetical protein
VAPTRSTRALIDEVDDDERPPGPARCRGTQAREDGASEFGIVLDHADMTVQNFSPNQHATPPAAVSQFPLPGEIGHEQYQTTDQSLHPS